MIGSVPVMSVATLTLVIVTSVTCVVKIVQSQTFSTSKVDSCDPPIPVVRLVKRPRPSRVGCSTPKIGSVAVVISTGLRNRGYTFDSVEKNIVY